VKRRVLFTTTAYPPSIGGVQALVDELRERLMNFEADVVTLWLQNRTDWLLGTTVKLGRNQSTVIAPGLTALGWSARTRMQMAPWVLSYYFHPQ
jgi:hypothetical protein